MKTAAVKKQDRPELVVSISARHVHLTDEHVETLDLDDDPELVVLQVYVTSASRAYRIADHYRSRGTYVATGGLPDRNHLLMQIYADVTGREFRISASKQAPALGSAMFGAVAAGKARGGHDSIFEAAQHMARLKEEVYRPIPEHKRVYDLLFAEYARLHDYFGRGENDVMKRLKKLKADVLGA